MRAFLLRTFTSAGGVVDNGESGIDALLPPEAAARLGVPEEVAIQLAGERHLATNALDGRIGSALLERLVAGRLERPAITAVAPRATVHASPALREAAPVLLNAVAAGDPQRRHTVSRYLDALIALTLQGEELRRTLVPVCIRLDDGARADPLPIDGAKPVAAVPLDDHERGCAIAALQLWLWNEAPAAHAAAIETLRRRARRDLERMAEYFASLDAEMAKAATRARSAPERARRAAKWAALAADLASKRAQLAARMRPRLSARIVAATVAVTRVEQFDIDVRRRSLTGTVSVRFRVCDGLFEGPACASCTRTTRRFFLCDERLHVLCEHCGSQGRLNPDRCRACRRPDPQWPSLVIPDPTANLRLGPLPAAGDRVGKETNVGAPAAGNNDSAQRTL